MVCLLPEFSFGQTSIASGNWNSATTWLGGTVPVANANVVISAGNTVTVDINTPIVNNVTVSGTLNIPNSASSTLSYKGDMVVSGSGTLINNGGIVQTAINKNFQLAGTGTYIHNPRNVTALDESIFVNSNENFSATSNLTIQKWFDTTVPLGASTRVSGDFGNVTMNIPDIAPWEQQDQFMTGAGFGRIKGTLTVSSGTVLMDDAFSTYMVFNDVIINGTGNIIFLSGSPRAFVLETNNFTDISTSPNPTIIMDNVFGFTQWNANGNVTLGHNFYGIRGTGVNPGGSLVMVVNGSLNITGGTVELVSQASAPLNLTVSSNTTISGTPTRVRFIDGNLGNLTFTTNNFIISAGGDNVIMGGNGLIPQATGNITININNDFIVNGPTATTILDASNSTKKLRINVGHDFIVNGVFGNITGARSKGAFTLAVANNCTLSAGKFIGQIDTLNSAIDSVVIGGNFLMNSTITSDYFRINYGTGNTFFKCTGNYTQSSTGTGQGIGFCGKFSNAGDMTFQVTGIFTMSNGRFSGIYNSNPLVQTGNLNFTASTNFNFSGGFFRGIDNRITDNTGTVNFTIGNLQYSGGNFSGYYSAHTAAGTANFNITGLLQITFNSAATDTFTFIGYTIVGSVVSNLKLNVTVAGNFNITGPNGSFISSVANGKETFSVNGNVNFSGGKNSFNSFPASGLPNSHPVVLNFNANFSVFGGSTYLSAHNDSLTATIGGNMSVSLGELIIQGGNTSADVNVLGGYNQTGGTMYLHKNATEFSYSIINMTINSNNDAIGDFIQTGGTINFDNNTQSTQVNLNVNSPSILYGGTGSMTMANPGTNLVSGVLSYGYNGTANFSRTSTTHNIQQVVQHILAGCTLSVNTGNLQIASYVNPTYNRLLITSGSVLDLKTNQMISNNQQANTGFTLYGRLRTARPQGFYDGTANAAINANNNMKFLILTNSVVEYNGVDNQVVTGTGVGTALTLAQKYYNLEINFNGTPNVEFVYPTNIPNDRTVFVRNKLILTNGELNLDNDHDPASGGRSIIIERDSITAITRTNGYIRSEVYDSTASVIWKINSVTGPHVIPFGYNAGNYIPFTFNLGSGNADTLIVSTYHTPAPTNLPYPPPVTHVDGVGGGDNSANTVDRFWYIQSTGTSTDANLTFVCTPAELGSIVNPRAQCWITDAPLAWQYPLQGAQSSIANGTLVQNADFYPENWWTLAGLSTPLPVTLLDFNSGCKDNYTELKWSTATEQNNQMFTILKSYDGTYYEPIGTVNGNGNSNQVIYYNYTDNHINTRLAYYKLRQTDYDGSTAEYGPVVANMCNDIDALDITVVPSSSNAVDIIIKSPQAGKYKVSLISVDGKLITNKVVTLDKGLNVVPLYAGYIASGIYFVNVTGTSASKTSKFPLGYTR